MDILYFLLKYAPFWAVPGMIIAGEFAYIYWLKSFKRPFFFLGFISFLCFIITAFYYWAGGPDKIVGQFNRLIQ